MESSIAVFLSRRSACERPPTYDDARRCTCIGARPVRGVGRVATPLVVVACFSSGCLV